MIKFRCPACGQKIAANDSAADQDVHCPSCAERIVVPWRSAPEFRAPAVTVTVNAIPPTAIPQSEPNPTTPAFTLANGPDALPQTNVKRGVITELAQMLRNRLLQALLSQRSHLLDSNHQATAQLLALEQRMGKLQEQYQARLSTYEKRVHDLERQLALAKKENRSLALRCDQAEGAVASNPPRFAPDSRTASSDRAPVLLRA